MSRITTVIFLLVAMLFLVTDAGGQTLTDTVYVKSEQEFQVDYKHYLLEGQDSVSFSSFSGNVSWPQIDGFSLIYKVGETTFAAPFNEWFSIVNETEEQLEQHKMNYASAGALAYTAIQDSALITVNYIAPTVFETREFPTLSFFSIDENPFLYSNTVVVVVEPTSGVSTENPSAIMPEDLSAELYPNPNPVNLTVKQATPGYGTIAIYDTSGRFVRQLANDTYMHNTTYVKLPLNDLASGTYLIVISNSTNKLVKSFSIVR